MNGSNIFSQAYSTILACWPASLGFTGALYGLETVNVVYDLNNSITFARGLAEAGLVFYFCVHLLGLDPKGKDINRKFAGFLLRYFLLLYVPILVVGIAVIFLLMAGSLDQSLNREAFLGLTVLSGAGIYFLTMFLFGTAFPAMLLGVRPGAGLAVGRAIRQARYLLPRLAFGVGGVMALGFAALILFENLGIGSDPVTPQGIPDPAGALALAAVKLISSSSFAVFAVVICQAYRKDLEEQGEHLPSEADVFA